MRLLESARVCSITVTGAPDASAGVLSVKLWEDNVMAAKRRGSRRSSARIMKRHPGGSRSIKSSTRKKSATIVEHKKGPRGGRTRYRFPMPDKAHAANALARLPQAKGLSAAQKARIRARAKKILGKK